MTTEKEKAKKYDEALEWMRGVYPTLTGAAKEDAEHYFPELKESEDERIRKAIVELVKRTPSSMFDADTEFNWIGASHDEILAYLEKQKESPKSADSIPSDCTKDAKCDDRSQKHNISVNEIAQDYIDGVKEYNPDPTWLLMQNAVRYGYHYCEQKEQKPSINIDQLKSLMLQYLQEAANEKDDAEIEADTDKWARKILGYDFEQKEQKSTVSREEILYQLFQNGSIALSDYLYLTKEQKPTDVIDPFSNANFVRGYESGYADAKRKQNSAEWSEEDKQNYKAIYSIIHGTYVIETQETQDKLLSWLKSLKPQPKNKWSKEDEKMLLSIINAFRNGSVSTIGQEQWLKLLPERFNLQPSLEHLQKEKVYDIMAKLTNLSYSNLIPFNSEEYKKINEITSDVFDLLKYPVEKK